MKILSLNTWGGLAGKEGILDFLKKHSDVDVFCLQEVWSGGEEAIKSYPELGDMSGIMHDFLDEASRVLSGHDYYFRPHVGDHYGLAIFFKKTLPFEQESEVFVHKNKSFIPEDHIGKHARNLQSLRIGGENALTIFNFHGLWNGQGKSDSPDRIVQSENIVKALKECDGPSVLIGDFNLLPDTESIKIIETAGLKNLITDYDITSTRTSLYKKDLRFADYAFSSPELNIENFEILPDEVSDHSALLLEITL